VKSSDISGPILHCGINDADGNLFSDLNENAAFSRA